MRKPVESLDLIEYYSVPRVVLLRAEEMDDVLVDWEFNLLVVEGDEVV
jgi:hypothetical protein